MAVPGSNEDRTQGFLGTFADEHTFRHWYESVLPRVYGYIHGRCGGDDDLAEELTQLTFTEAVRTRTAFAGQSEPITWLCSIARHKLADHYRRLDQEERRFLRLVIEERPPFDVEAAWPSGDRREAVNTALRSIPAMQRAALVFRYLDGLSVRQTAAMIGRTESATESLLSRARDNFRRAYQEPADV